MVYDDNFYSSLLLSLPIETDFGLIKPYTIEEILKYGYSQYFQKLSVFFTDIDQFDLTDDAKSQFNIFDLLFFRQNKNDFILKMRNEKNDVVPILFNILDSIIFFMRCDCQIDFSDNCILIDNKYQINRNNYTNFVELIFKIYHTQKPKTEKPPKFENERQKSIYEKLLAGRKRKEKNNDISFSGIINAVIYGGGYHIPKNEVLNMSMYELINAYESKLQIDFCDKQYKQYLAGAKVEDLDLEHWSQKLNIFKQ
jgi:hypothetical protein